MPIDGSVLADMTREEIFALFEAHNCASCGEPINELDPHPAEGDTCSDCYFKMLGEEVEAHPIYFPRRG